MISSCFLIFGCSPLLYSCAHFCDVRRVRVMILVFVCIARQLNWLVFDWLDIINAEQQVGYEAGWNMATADLKKRYNFPSNVPADSVGDLIHYFYSIPHKVDHFSLNNIDVL
jgi:hypothetical protein